MDKALALRVMAAMQDKLSGPLKKIENNAAASAVGVVQLRDTLKALNATQRDIGAFRDLKRGLQGTHGEMTAAQQNVATLAQQMRAVDNPTRAMTQSFDAAVHSAQQLKEKHDQQSLALQQSRERLALAGVSTSSLVQHERSLRLGIANTNQALTQQETRLKAVAERHEHLANVRQKLDNGRRFVAGVADTGKNGLAAGRTLSRPLGAMVSAFAPAENAATELKIALMTGDGSVAQDFEHITELATQLGDKLPGTTADYQNMMTVLRRQGMSSTSILNGLGEATAYLGVLLKLPGSASAEFAADLKKATHTADADMMGLMDVIQRTFHAGVDPTVMLSGFTKLSPAFQIIGKDGLEASKMLAPLLVMMNQAGIAGESAGIGLSKALQSGLDQTSVEKANALINGAGFKFKMDFTNGSGEFAGIEKMLAQLEQLNELNSVQRTNVLRQLFGDDAQTLQAVAALMSQGMNGYAQVVAQLQNQGGLQQRVQAQSATLINVVETAWDRATNSLSEVGNTVAPELKELFILLGEMAAGFGKWVREHPAFTAGAVKVLAVVAALATVVGTLATALATVLAPLVFTRFLLAQTGVQMSGLSGVLTYLVSALQMAGGAVLSLGRFLLMSPLGLLITAIGIAAYVIYQYWQPISAFFQGLWATVSGTFAWAFNGITALLQSLNPMGTLTLAWNAVIGFFGNLWGQVRTAFDGGIAAIGASLMNWSPFGSIYSAITSALSLLGITLPGQFSEFGRMLMQGLVQGVTNMATTVKETISNMGGAVIGWFKEKLGIASPSRAFIEMGEFVSEGAAVGISRQQPAASKAAHALAASIAIGGAITPTSVALAAPGAATQVSTIANDAEALNRRFDMRAAVATAPTARSLNIQGDNITIQIHDAGASAADIGRAVEDALRRRDSEKAARLRSAYYDEN
ncbi:Phage-related minor tail protein [compost metagenome]